MSRSISFIYFTNPSDSSGIELKMNNFYKAFLDKGFAATKSPIDVSLGILPSTKSLFETIKNNTDYYFVRYNNSRNIVFLFFFILLKFNKNKLIIEVPTPITNNVDEIKLSSANLFRKLYMYITTFCLGPIPLSLGNLVLQYANESSYFGHLAKNQTLLIGNGIDTNSYLHFTGNPDRFKSFDELQIVIIANLASWHGVDLLLNALKDVEFKYKVHIVGNGVEKHNLMELSEKLALSKYVKFYGKLDRVEYLKILEKSHLGIGSLNWDIINVKFSSALKLREYVSVGLPILFSSFDPDLSENEYCYQVQCNVESIKKNLLKAYSEIRNFDQKVQLRLAKNTLDMPVKVDTILAILS